MRTTISIDEELMDQLMQSEKGVSRSEAVRRAIVRHVYLKRVDDLIASVRANPLDLDWREMRQQSIEHARELERRWDGSVRERDRKRRAR